MRAFSLGMAALVAALATGCGGGAGGTTAKGPDGKAVTDGKGNKVSAAAAGKFKQGLDEMARHDKANDWNDAACTSTAQLFLDAASEQNGAFAEAIYNAGLAYQRCKKDKEARAKFAEVLQKDPKFHRARVQVALYSFADSGEKNVDQAIAEMKQAVTDAQFKNVEALVNLAMLQMRRGNSVSDQDGENDFARAKLNLQRALAIDDAFMPAFNQLAVYYLQTAKLKAGREMSKKTAGGKTKEKKIDTQALELAALVCSQAIRKNANYAPIHNTAGMIQVELGNLNGAVQSFGSARRLDPNFFEAHMNYAAVNMRFRGFQQAEEAYKAAVRIRPNDYDAHLGLALALRGRIDDSNFDAMLKASEAELEAAKKLAPERPEAYYNHGILTQEFKAKGGKESDLNAAKNLFGQFISKAGGKAEYASEAKSAKERMEEIDEIIKFNRQSEKDRKAAEAEMKNKAAEAEVKAAEEGGN